MNGSDFIHLMVKNLWYSSYYRYKSKLEGYLDEL